MPSTTISSAVAPYIQAFEGLLQGCSSTLKFRNSSFGVDFKYWVLNVSLPWLQSEPSNALRVHQFGKKGNIPSPQSRPYEIDNRRIMPDNEEQAMKFDVNSSYEF